MIQPTHVRTCGFGARSPQAARLATKIVAATLFEAPVAGCRPQAQPLVGDADPSGYDGESQQRRGGNGVAAYAARAPPIGARGLVWILLKCT